MTKTVECLVQMAQTLLRYRLATNHYTKATSFNIRMCVEHCALTIGNISANDEDMASAELCCRLLSSVE